MGRSQVLFNRTKGRLRNRPGAGRGRTNPGDRFLHTPPEKIVETDGIVAPQPQQPPSRKLSTRSAIDENVLLLAEQPMYTTFRSTEEVEESHLFGGVGSGGTLDIASMAATFRSMSLDERLKIPRHVALCFTQHASDEDVAVQNNHLSEMDHAETKFGNTSLNPKPSSEEMTAPTPKHANITAAYSKESKVEESESFLEDWLDEAMQSKCPGTRGHDDASQPPHEVSISANGHDDDCSSVTAPLTLSSSIGSTTTSKLGARSAEPTEYPIHELPVVAGNSSQGGGSSVDSRGNLQEDEGAMQPEMTNRCSHKLPSTSERTREDKDRHEDVGEDLDAWLDSVIS